MKPTPGGFGGWSCQSLGSFSGGGGTTYRSSGGRGGIVYGGGGGGVNYAAAGAVAGYALGILFEAAHQAEQARASEQAAANAEAARQAAARHAYCMENFRQASADMQNGNDSLLRAQPAAAKQYYERAIALLSRCGDSRNIAVVRRNLAIVDKQYAATKDDNRVDEARRRNSGALPNSGPNPFNAAPAADDPLNPRVLTNPNEVLERARMACSYAERTPEWNRCMQTQEARLIMDSDPDIKASCGWERNAVVRTNCAIEAYVKKLQMQVANALADDPCYFNELGRQCFAGGGGARTAGGPKESIRDRLRRQLAAMRDREGRDPNVTEADIDAAIEADKKGAAAASVQIAQSHNSDDPLQNFLRSSNATRDYTNAGEFAQHPDMTGLEPTPEQRREMRLLLEGQQYGPPSPPPEIYGPPSPPPGQLAPLARP